MKGISMKRLWLGLLLALTLSAGLIATTSSDATTPAKTATCTFHTNEFSEVYYSTTQSHVLYSNAAWYRALYKWNSCTGGIRVVFSFDPDCHLRAWLYDVGPDGTTSGPGVLEEDRGSTCVARPGTLQFQKAGPVRTVSGAGTVLSSTPYLNPKQHMWDITLWDYRHHEEIAWAPNPGDPWSWVWNGPKWPDLNP